MKNFRFLDSILNIGASEKDDINYIRLLRQLNGLNLFYTIIALSVGIISFAFLNAYPGGIYMGIVQVVATVFYASNLYHVSRRHVRITQYLTIHVFEWHLFACAFLTGIWYSPVMLVIVLFPLLAALVEVSIISHLFIGLFQFLVVFIIHSFFGSAEESLNRYFALAVDANEIIRNMGLIYFPIMAAGIIKIIFNENLRARERLKNMVEQLADAHSQLRSYADQLKDESIRMKAEINVARDIQLMILPKDSEVEDIRDLSIAGTMIPADEVGGDYYDIIPMNPSPIIGIGDVTGHGLSSGLIMLMAQTAVKTVAELGYKNPEDFLPVVNRVLFSNIQRIGVDKNMTLSLISYQGEGNYKIAGQHESYLICRNDGSLEIHDTMDLGFFIGMMYDVDLHLDSKMFNLSPGDILFLYTDGVTEAVNEEGIQYGLENLGSTIVQYRQYSAEEIKERVLRKLYNYIGNANVYDDISFVVVKQNGKEGFGESKST